MNQYIEGILTNNKQNDIVDDIISFHTITIRTNIHACSLLCSYWLACHTMLREKHCVTSQITAVQETVSGQHECPDVAAKFYTLMNIIIYTCRLITAQGWLVLWTTGLQLEVLIIDTLILNNVMHLTCI